MKLEEKLWKTFNKALGQYQLIDEGDHILVGLSGGKDSLLLLEFLARRSKVHVPRFKVSALHVRMEDVAYETDTTWLQQFCNELGVPLHIVTTSFVQPAAIPQHQTKPACFLCSWQRRKQLFNLAQEIGCNKIALGHHQDDIIHTSLMNLVFQGHFSSMPALLKMDKMPLSIIRPLCLCDEADIQAYAYLKGYEKQVKRCPYEHDTHRTSARELFEKMQQMNGEARYSIWHALESVMKMVPFILLLLVMAMPATAQRRKQVLKPVEPPSEQEERIRRMTETTQRIMFIDSIVMPKEEFLKAYHLSEEAGRIAPYSTLFPKSTLANITFMNALGNRCLFAENDSTLSSQEKLQQQWTMPDTLAGINSEHQLQDIGFPFMMPDGITLYLAAKGEESIGGYDIFMTTYDAAEGVFLKPENIGMPFNSIANDYLFAIDEYNQLGFFASDRNQSDSTVCIYTFVPVEKYQTYDASQYTQEQIAAFARIDRISATHDNETIYQEALQRLQKAKASPAGRRPSFEFVINDQTVYHQLSDFKANGNQKRYRQLVQLQQRYEQVISSLEKARGYFPKASTQERSALSREILDNEQAQLELHEAICQQEKLIRQAENTYLTKKDK